MNLAGLVIFALLWWLTARRGATDPVCGMKVDRAKAVTKELGGETFYFCSEHCLHAFEADPDRYIHPDAQGTATQHAHDHGASGDDHHAHREHSAVTVTDPVCGMTVEPEHALPANHDGETYAFCSAGCRERFLADPDHYLPAAAVSRRSS